jgi:autotransporter-associated beta strand protein
MKLLLTLWIACATATTALGFTKDFYRGTDLGNPTNYTPSGAPDLTTDVRLATPALNLTIPSFWSVRSLAVVNGNSYTISINNTAIFNSALRVYGGGINLSGNSNLTLQGANAGTGTAQMVVSLTYDSGLHVLPGSTLNISANITGAVVLTGLQNSNGTTWDLRGGTTVFSAVNTYWGTDIYGGTLKLVGGGTLGQTHGYLSVANGTLDLNSTNQSVGALWGYSSAVANGASGGSIINSGSSRATLEVGRGDADGAYDGEISGNIALVKAGAGLQKLTSANTYTGGTTINDGTVHVNNSTGSGTGSGLVTVGSGATLGGSGAIAGPVVVSGGRFTPGVAGLGDTLETGALSLVGDSTFVLHLNTQQVTHDSVNVTGDLSLSLANTIVLTLSDKAAASAVLDVGTVLQVIRYNGIWNGGLFTYGGNVLHNGDTFAFGANTYEISYDTASAVQLSVVPEPNVSALLLGAGLSLVGLRRLHRSKH